jgi:HK97 family phage prohead protease
MQRLDCGLMEVKFVAGETEAMTFSGYGAVFGNIDSYGDMIQKGAFAATLREAKKTGQWPAMLMQHGGWGMGADDMTPVGIWSSLEEDDIGLKVDGKFADTARGREAYALLKMSPRPAITGLSIGYIAKEWGVGTKPDEPRRTLKKIELLEVSLVTFPANPKARIQSVKSGLTIRAAEQALREVGFSQSEAKAILADGFKSISSRDAGDLGDLAELIRRNTATFTH